MGAEPVIITRTWGWPSKATLFKWFTSFTVKSDRVYSVALGTHALSRPTFSAILEKTNLGSLGRVVAFGSSGLENTNFKWKMHQKYTKNWQHLSLKRYSQSLSQRGWVIFPWAKPAWQNTGFLPLFVVLCDLCEIKKTVRFTSILDTFWHCAISWVGRSGRKRRDVRYVQRACLTNHCKYVYCLSRTRETRVNSRFKNAVKQRDKKSI